jgi:hypothetical protein
MLTAIDGGVIMLGYPAKKLFPTAVRLYPCRANAKPPPKKLKTVLTIGAFAVDSQCGLQDV